MPHFGEFCVRRLWHGAALHGRLRLLAPLKGCWHVWALDSENKLLYAWFSSQEQGQRQQASQLSFPLAFYVHMT